MRLALSRATGPPPRCPGSSPATGCRRPSWWRSAGPRSSATAAPCSTAAWPRWTGARAFAVTLQGGRAFGARRLPVTIGLVDEVPEVPGLRELWGTDVVHCPYCHGYEVPEGSPGRRRAALRYPAATGPIPRPQPAPAQSPRASGSRTTRMCRGRLRRASGVAQRARTTWTEGTSPLAYTGSSGGGVTLFPTIPRRSTTRCSPLGGPRGTGACSERSAGARFNDRSSTRLPSRSHSDTRVSRSGLGLWTPTGGSTRPRSRGPFPRPIRRAVRR